MNVTYEFYKNSFGGSLIQREPLDLFRDENECKD